MPAQQLALADEDDPFGFRRYNPGSSLFLPRGGNMCHPGLGWTGSGELVPMGSGELARVSSDMMGSGAMGSGVVGSPPGGKTEVAPVKRKVAPPTEEKDVGKDAGTSKVARVSGATLPMSPGTARCGPW